MRLPGGLRRVLRLEDPSRDVAEELSFHFDETVAELRGQGMSEAEARAEAERRFGDVRAYRTALVGLSEGRARAVVRTRRWEAAGEVVRHALRSVLRAPALSIAVVLTFGVGVGANVAMLAIVERLLFAAPLHLAEPEQVRRLMTEEWSDARGRTPTAVLAYGDFLDAARAPSVAAAAAWTQQRLTLGHGLEATELDGYVVSPGYFDLRGARPARGRFLQPEDHAEGAEGAVVISHALWQSRFGGAADVVGRTLDFGSGPRTIVGVAPRGMTSLLLQRADVWLPLKPTQDLIDNRRMLMFHAVVRLRPDAAEASAVEQMSALLRQGRAADIAQARFDASARMLATPLLEARGPQALPEATVAKWLAGVSLLVLLLACVNVANLLLARAVRQVREVAVRLALGISRRRLLAQTLMEGLLLGAAGGAAALLLAQWLGTAMSASLLPGIAWQELGWSARVVALGITGAFAAGIAAALLPALHLTRPATAGALRGVGTAAAGRDTSRTRAGLAVVQAALSAVLLVGAGLFVRSLDAARAVDLGYALEDLQYVELRYVPGSTTRDERVALSHAVLERLHGHPAVARAAAANTAPFLMSWSNEATVPGRELTGDAAGPHWFFQVSADYFRLLGMDAVRGRLLSAADATTGARVAVVNETMARALWPDGDAVGGCLVPRGDTECLHVVGVVRDTKQRYLLETGSMQYFVPLSPRAGADVIMVRPRPGTGSSADVLRAAALEVDARIRFVQVTPASERIAPQVRSWRLGAAVFSGFGVLALLLAALGLYAVLAFDVSQRRREIGVRSALGASRRSILWLVLGRGAAVTCAGVAAGVAAAALLAPRLEASLFQVGPHDPFTYATVATTLLATAAAAALLPARRAAAVDPNEALRSD